MEVSPVSGACGTRYLDARSDALSSFETKAGLCQPIAGQVDVLPAAFVQSTSVSVWCRGTSCTTPMRGSNLVGVAQMCGDPSVPTARRGLCNSLSLTSWNLIYCNHVYIKYKRYPAVFQDSVISSNLQDPFATQSKTPPKKMLELSDWQEAYDVDPVLALDVWSSAAPVVGFGAAWEKIC